MPEYQPVPAAQRLSLGDVFADADILVQLFMVVLVALVIASAAIWALNLSQERRRSGLGDRVLSGVLVAAPLLGLLAASFAAVFRAHLRIATPQP